MTIRTFLVGIAAVTLVCLAAWIAEVILIDPYRAGWVSLTLFYFSLFLWVCGALILGIYYVRSVLGDKAMPHVIVATAVRQAILAALALDVILILAGFKMLNWINGSLLVISAVFIESYFLTSYHERTRRDR